MFALATVFGDVLLQAPEELGQPSLEDEHKCAMFFRHFIDIAT